MSSSASAIGIDIGGSKIAAGLVTDGGTVLRRAEVPTPAREGGSMIITAAAAVAAQVAADAAPVAVGVGTAGIVDRFGTVVSATDLLTDWIGVDVAGRIGAELSGGREVLPVAVANDVHAHAVGEARAGAGADAETVLVVAAGTGLGGAVVQHGAPVVGSHGAAGHLGHLPSAAAGDLLCSCGRTGHLEAVASGYGLLQLYRSMGGAGSVPDARALGALTADDPIAERAVVASGHALGSTIGGAINLVDPDLVIISGGLIKLGAPWWSSVRDGTASSVLPYLDKVRLVAAKRGDDAAIIGAALLAFDRAGAAE